MLQSGWQLGGSHPIDSLQYTYYDHSNKLMNVIDGRNDTLTTMGDFRTSALSPYSTGKTTGAIDYVYDVNGNMTRDLNKDIGSQSTDGITYNHLNLPWQIKVRSASGTKGTITYIYDATGNKLEKRTMDSVGNVQTHTAYIGPFQYQGKSSYNSSSPADTLLFFGQEEGRVRVTTDTTSGQPLTSFKYDYFIKDHLGNTRMVLTDEQESDKYIAATMEVADSVLENRYYSNLTNTRADLPAGYPTDTTTNPNIKVARLNGGSAGPKIGPGITLKVMAGDQFSIRVSSWYRLNGATPGSPANPLDDLLASLISGVGNLPGGGHPSMATLQANSAPLSDNITEFLSDTGSSINSSKPHAFVNWILFDNQFNYVAESSGFDQVGGDQEFKKHTLMNLPVTKSGYLYIYLSNTSNIDVYFDNLQVTHTRGPLTEEDHYYPFGLTMSGISDKALKGQYAENKHLYNGKELQNKEFSDGSGLEEYDYEARFHDPQLGRFTTIDPLSAVTKRWSSYTYAVDNPVRFLDPDGRNPRICWDQPQRKTSIDLDGNGRIIHINQDGDPGVYMIADPNGPRSLIGYMDPNKKYTIGGTYQYYDKKDYYEKYPLVYVFGVRAPTPGDPNPDQNNLAAAGREAMGGVALLLLLDIDAPEGAGAGGAGLTSAQMGRIIGWGEGATAEAVAQTKAVAESLTSEQIQLWAKQGLTKEWVAEQLELYTKALAKGGDKLKNINLIPRKELMEKILNLWK